MAHRARACLLIAALVACRYAGAAEYFIDSDKGSDRNTGARTAPLKSLKRLARLTLKPGDVVRFKRGCVFRGTLKFQGNGAKGRPIRISAYGEGPKPEILGSERMTGWRRHAGEVYKLAVRKTRFDSVQKPWGVFVYDKGRAPVRLGRDRAIPRERGWFSYDQAAETLYVCLPDGSDPSLHRIEVPVRYAMMRLVGRSWIVVQDLAFLFANSWQIWLHNCRDVVVRDCASLFPGRGNNLWIGDNSTRTEVLNSLLYDQSGVGVWITSGATRCRVAGCVIANTHGEDGLSIHCVGRDKRNRRKRVGLAGDHNVVENNVIGLSGEESIDITSGDHHVVRGNICYGNGNPGIIVGHDSDHILIQNNICFGNRSSGIHLTGRPKAGAVGGNRVLQNLVYENWGPGLQIMDRGAEIYNNTIVNSYARPAVRLDTKHAHGAILRNNLIVTADPVVRFPSLQFMWGDPKTSETKLSHNFFLHAGKRHDRVIRTWEDEFSPAEFVARFGQGQASRIADPKFVQVKEGYYFLAADSPAVDAGVNVGLPFRGKAPDLGWKERGLEKDAPRYPEVMLTGEPGDEAVLLYLWGKTRKRPPPRPRPTNFESYWKRRKPIRR